MSKLITFNFQTSQVRTTTDSKGEIWFMANDVCNILGYSNPTKTIGDNCKQKGVTKIDTATKGGKQAMVYINEPNLYRLVIKSRKAEAEKFEEWVMEEVLPSIRKTGTYTTDRPSTVHDRRGLVQAVSRLTHLLGVMHPTVWALVHDYMNVESIDELSASQIPTATAYVQSLIINQENKPNQAELYTVLSDNAVHLRDYARILRAIPLASENALDDVVKSFNGIRNLAAKMGLKNRQHEPMFDGNRLNFYSGSALILR